METIEVRIHNTGMPREYFEQAIFEQAASEAGLVVEVLQSKAPVVEERHGAVDLVTLVFEISVLAGPAVAKFVAAVRTKVAARNAGEEVNVKGNAGYL